MPDVHQHHGEPGGNGLARVVVVDAERIDGLAEQADVRQRHDVPHGAHDVPRNEQRQRHQNEADRHPRPLARHGERDGKAERNLDGQHDGREQDLPPQRSMEARRHAAPARTSCVPAQKNSLLPNVSCTEKLTTVISGMRALKATSRKTGRTKNQACLIDGLVHAARPLAKPAIFIDLRMRGIEGETCVASGRHSPP